ncbi:MAG TPA: hypothetical protein PKZ31_03030 [Kaistella chaponensis]|nr:hypothetical protein [Kaistella chaponensis]HPW88056.1 hypothetical protein [Kaistella chaponensis]
MIIPRTKTPIVGKFSYWKFMFFKIMERGDEQLILMVKSFK